MFVPVREDRRALCYVQTLKPKLAVTDFKKVLSLEPNNALARQQLETTQKLIRKTEFEKVVALSSGFLDDHVDLVVG